MPNMTTAELNVDLAAPYNNGKADNAVANYVDLISEPGETSMQKKDRIRELIADHPNTCSDISAFLTLISAHHATAQVRIHHMIDRPTAHVDFLFEVASWPASNRTALERLVAQANSDLRCLTAVATHPNASIGVLTGVITHPNADARVLAAACVHPNANAALLAQVAGSANADRDCLLAVAINVNSDKAALDAVLANPKIDATVLSSIITNPNADVDVLVAVAQRTSSLDDIAQIGRTHFGTAPELLEALEAAARRIEPAGFSAVGREEAMVLLSSSAVMPVDQQAALLSASLHVGRTALTDAEIKVVREGDEPVRSVVNAVRYNAKMY